ncbi:class I SAM-dependent rRNA methyltransferase [Paralimibaculum aggregatum]|uniref:Class I SAM-dependent rRNA methyltransferase n=1 Tax=Paralimibaculum aggregatum TaxID=3036245 RepID=A0ABQ6LQB8_9RHOB|nr:class I SAM-dependent methyltransferase [Limibaculum sp. NKW23]GMG83243.1 class I SAM-dependent rRNA methyltransferase [Limibaculum sp. NKW23]
MTESPTDPAASRPTVKLRPGKGRRLSQGAPWAYADEIAMDRRTKALEPGSLVRLVEGDRVLGLAAFNGQSQLAARLIDPDPEAEIGPDWFAARLGAALRLREAFHDAPFYRLVHAEGDGFPGLVIDRFGEAVVVQPNAAWIERCLPDLLAGLEAVLAPATVVISATSRARRLEGLETRLEVLGRPLDGPVEVAMNGAVYLADLAGGQKTGLYFDQRGNHAAAAALASGRDVLDVFTHVGGFGLACIAGGAARAVAVDSSEPALALAAEAARRMGVTDRFETRAGDAFDALRAAAEAGERYGMVICDPPAFAPHKGALEAGLRAYARLARLAAPLVEPEGWLVLCSCSGAVSAEAFREACTGGIGAAGRQAALVLSGRAGPDHPQHMALPETGYLKALTFRMQP